MKHTHSFRISPWFSLLGLLGFLGFLPSNEPPHSTSFFFLFFSFFGWFFWGLLGREFPDERLLENQQRAGQIMLRCFTLLSFFLLLALSKGAAAAMVLRWGSLAYAFCFILSPALIWYFDRVAQ